MRDLAAIILSIATKTVGRLTMKLKHTVHKVTSILQKIRMFFRVDDTVKNVIRLDQEVENNTIRNVRSKVLDPSSSFWGLNRKQLIYELIKARAEREEMQRRYDEIFQAYKSTAEKALESILHQPEQPREATKGETRPIRVARQAWSAVAARKEAEDKQNYWKEKAKELEKDVKING